ncbi:helix-turn-helix domain-containing protein [Rhodococcus aetherivorans]|uniref:helix-turn-helix domain-containing protein n=1 Tax=Rhodococcus aetherivorans TaxID=191292 RepID=UPI001E61CF97|nr:helix-turn-helix transcriptional regulator [Rhodococcus aetherivorans]
MTAAMRETNWTPADTLAHRFILVRTQLGMDRKSFAELTGLTENQLQSIEAGRSPRELDKKVQMVHDATGVSREWLMWGGPLEQKTPRHLGRGDGGLRGITAE